MRTRLGFWLLLFPSLAHANGAMGLGLEIWSPDSWLWYCIAMVLAEAWLINLRTKLPWYKALLISLGANAVTGIACGPLGCCAVFLHTPSLDPNPLQRSILVLVAFAVPSALVESVLWTRFVAFEQRQKLVGWAVAVHLITIPIGWLILMVPERPYRGIEKTAALWRSNRLRSGSRRINDFILDKERLPNALNAKALLDETNPYASDGGLPLTIEAFYSPYYTRFSTGEEFKRPLAFNRRIAGKTPAEIKKMTKLEAVPYITGDSRWGDITGLFYFPASGTVERRYYVPDDSSVDWGLK